MIIQSDGTEQSGSSPKSVASSCQRQEESFHLIGLNPEGTARSAFSFLGKKKGLAEMAELSFVLISLLVIVKPEQKWLSQAKHFYYYYFLFCIYGKLKGKMYMHIYIYFFWGGLGEPCSLARNKVFNCFELFFTLINWVWVLTCNRGRIYMQALPLFA